MDIPIQISPTTIWKNLSHFELMVSARKVRFHDEINLAEVDVLSL